MHEECFSSSDTGNKEDVVIVVIATVVVLIGVVVFVDVVTVFEASATFCQSSSFQAGSVFSTRPSLRVFSHSPVRFVLVFSVIFLVVLLRFVWCLHEAKWTSLPLKCDILDT